MTHILLATYNGERYLQQQIESILSQTNAQWRLFVRDDGSTDQTLAIVKRYIEQYPEQIFFLEDSETHLGAKKSFETLLTKTPGADYYMFSDQDDIWLPQKLEISLQHIHNLEQQHGKECPLLVHSDLRVVDEQQNMIAPSFWKYSYIKPEVLDHEIHYLAICNSVTGCTTLFNKAAREAALPFSSQAYMHDSWLAVSTLLHGGIVHPIKEATILYRQHSQNEVGAKAYKFSLNIKEKMRLARQCYASYHPLVFKSKLSFWYWKCRCFIKEHLL